MAALSLVSVLLFVLPVRVEVIGCESQFDLPALDRQLRLEWPDPPEGAEVNVRCAETWELSLRATGKQPRTEPLALPLLSAESRVRVLALIITERGRALSAPELVPSPPPSPPVPRAPLTAIPVVEVAPVETPSGSPLRGALLAARLSDVPDGSWRIGLGATSLTPFLLGPWRFGPQLRVQRGFFGVSISGTWGSLAAKLGTVTPATFSIEPEVTIGCVTARIWQVCGGARGILGYGSISATTTVSGVTPSQFAGPMLGGAGQLGASLRLTPWLALDLDGLVGGTWAVAASQDKEPIAAIGGAFAGALVALTASWSGP